MSNYKLETPIDITPSGVVRLFETNSTNAISIASASTSVDLDFTLPANAGSAGQFLQRTSATSTAWVTGTATQTSNTLPINLRLAQGNLPSVGFSTSSGAFTTITVFIYGGTITNRIMRNMYVLFTVTPAGSSGEIRLRDVTGGLIVVTTLTCTSATTGLTIATAAIPSTFVPTAQSIMEISGRVTTATTISFHSLLLT